MSKMLENIKKINWKKYLVFLIYFFSIAVAAIVIDQVTKVLAENFLTLGEPTPFIPGFIDFTLVYNTGAAFGMGDDTLWIRIIFVLLSWIVALFLIGYAFYLIYKDKKINTFFGVTLALILGGDIGNLIDRTFFFDRGVVDFISIQSWWPNFGIFNIADACLVVGIFMLIGYLIYDEIKTSKEEKEHNENVKKLEEKENEVKENKAEVQNETVSQDSETKDGEKSI